MNKKQKGLTRVGPQPCPLCKEVFDKHIHKQLHLHLEHKDELVFCAICTKPHCSDQELSHHQRKFHPGAASSFYHPCKLCKREFSHARYLSEHIEKDHEEGEGIFKCKYCQCEFSLKRSLSYHYDVDHEEEEIDVPKAFVCSVPICQKRFSTPANLDQHSRCHNRKPKTNKANPKPKTACEVCGKMLALTQIKDHHKAYHEEKKFLCQDCPKAFMDSRGLKAHRLKTHVKRQLICPIPECKKVFHCPTVLRKHLTGRHASTKQQCPRCDKQFQYSKDLQDHIKGYHEGVKSLCSVCGKGFVRPSEKNRHERKVHQINNYVYKIA